MTETVKLGDIFKFEPKSNLKAESGQDRGAFPFYTSRSTQTKFIDSKNYDGEAIIIGISGSANIHYEENGFSTSSNCIVAKLKGDAKFKLKFIYYYLLGNKYILAQGFTGSGYKVLSKEYIQNLTIPVFALEKQNKLIDDFDNIYHAIALRRESQSLLNKYLINYFLKINNKTDSTNIIKNIVKEIRSGPSGESLNKKFYLKDNSKKGYKIYTHKDLTEDLDPENEDQTNYIDRSRYERLYNYIVKQGDVLITRVGIMGKALVISNKFEA